MKYIYLFMFSSIVFFQYSQNVGINATGSAPNASAILDVDATNKGFLPPRVALSAVNNASPITSPATALLIYNTATASTGTNAVTPGYYFWNGTKWVQVIDNASGGPNNWYDQATSSPAISNTANVYQLGNVGIGIANPNHKLHVSQGNVIATNNSFTHFGSYSYHTAAHPVFMGVRGRGTEASPSYPQSGDVLNSFIGRDAIDFGATNYGESSIYMYATENFSSANKGSNLIFNTTTNGTNTATTKMIINHNGNVGIGTTVPTGLIDVKDSDGNRLNLYTGHSMFMSNPKAASGNMHIGYNLFFDGTWKTFISSKPNAMFHIGDGTTAQDASFSFYTAPAGSIYPSGATARMVILNDGKIGIGTSAPITKLHVSGGAIQTAGYVVNGVFEAQHPAIQLKGNVSNKSAFIGYDDVAATGGLQIWTGATTNDPAASGVWAVKIRDNGNVGINTTGATEKLDVVGNVKFSGALMPNNTAGTAGQLLVSAGAGAPPTWTTASAVSATSAWQLNGNTGTTAGTNFIGTTDAVDFVTKTNGTERMRIVNATGNVGIGTNAPNAKLDVAGSIYASSGNFLSNVNATNGILGNIQLFGKNSVASEPNERRWAIYNMNEYSNASGLQFWEYYDRNNNGVLCDDGANDCGARMIIRNGTGYVGISTATPLSKLHVEGGKIIAGNVSGTMGSSIIEGRYSQTATSDDALNILGSSYSSGGTSLLFGARTSSVAADQFMSSSAINIGRSAVNLDGQGFKFYTDAVGTTAIGGALTTMSEKMRLTNAGSLGVGTTAPTARIHTDYTINQALFKATTAATDMTFYEDSDLPGMMNIRSFAGSGIVFQDADQPILKIHKSNFSVGVGLATPVNKLDVEGAVAIGSSYSGSSTAPANGLLVEGNVGIGTSSPSSKLEIVQVGTNDGITVRNGTNPLIVTTDGTIRTKLQTITGSYGYVGTETNHDFSIITNNSAKVTVSANGNVGIGTTSSGAKLDVNGAVKITDGTQGLAKVLTSDASGNASWQNLYNTANSTGDVTRGALPVGANCPSGGSYTSAGVTLQPGVYIYSLYACVSQIGQTGSGFFVGATFLSGSGTATSTWHDFNSGTCGVYYTGVVKVYTTASVGIIYQSYGGSSFTVPGANAETAYFIRIL